MMKIEEQRQYRINILKKKLNQLLLLFMLSFGNKKKLEGFSSHLQKLITLNNNKYLDVK